MEIKRKAFYKIKDVIKSKRIAILVGLRREVKTTILNQLKDENEKKSKIITYDNLFIRQFIDLQFLDFINNIITSEKKELILLDEIQVRKNWDIIVKNLLDRYNKQGINFVVTDSSSLSFEAKNIGVTRIEKVLIHTLDFSEYLNFTNLESNFKNFENYLCFSAFPEFINKKIL